MERRKNEKKPTWIDPFLADLVSVVMWMEVHVFQGKELINLRRIFLVAGWLFLVSWEA